MSKYTITVEVEAEDQRISDLLDDFEDTFHDQPGASVTIARDGVEVGRVVVQPKSAAI